MSLCTLSAQADDDSKHLVQSCRELVDIYSKRDQQRLLAGVATGLSEALRAGYCMGVVEEYRRHAERCTTNDWFEQAQRVALVPLSQRTTVQGLLEMSCAI